MHDEGFGEEEYDDMEDWEADAALYYQKDWKGLVEYRFRQAQKYPGDHNCQWRLGEAYVLNKEYEKAISFLLGLHKKHPDDPNVQGSLLDALFAIGKDETDIEWVIKPNALRLDNDILDICCNILKGKRKPRSVAELYVDLYSNGFPAFDEDQLMEFLLLDHRLEFTGSTDYSFNCYVKVLSKRSK